MRRICSATLLLVPLLGLAGLRAQKEPAPARVITIQNLAGNSRQDWFAVPVPFARGAVPARQLPDLHVEDHATVWQPFGARWPDGSIKQALCLFRAELAGSRSARLALRAGPGPELGELPAIAVQPDLVVVVHRGKQRVAAVPELVRVLEKNAARRVSLLRCRVPDTGLVFEVIVEQYAGQEHVWTDVGVFFSDPTIQDVQRRFDLVAVVSKGAALLLRHPGPLALKTKLTKTGSRVTLLQNQVVGDGQGIRRTGVLLPALRSDGSLRDLTLLAAAVAPPLGATDWRSSGAWGPFGYAPDPPPWLRGSGLTLALQGRHKKFLVSSRGRSKDPFRNFRFGLAKEAGQTGDQEDFGVVKLSPVAATGLPSFLLEVELSVLQEACRPVHFFEADGSPVQSSEHPDWVVWSGRTHWHCDMSADRLGKPCPPANFDSHSWTGKDRQHWSSLYLTGYYLLTGKHWVLREIENEVQIYMASQTIDPKFITTSSGAPRGAGRVMLTACWLFQCTGDTMLLQRIHDRVDKVHWRGWHGRKLKPEQVRTFQIASPDARMLGGKVRYWTPWQDALAAVGFEAFFRMTGNPRARKIADGVALNVLRHGWLLPKRGEPIIATALRWKDNGDALTPQERRGKENVLWSYGTAFSTWAIGATEIARAAAERTKDPRMKARAEGLLKYLRGTRSAPRDRWFDRFGEWDGVR